jgi:hypothetical protein
MHASSSAIDSAFPPSRRKRSTTATCDATQRTLRVVILDIAMTRQDQESVLNLRREREEAVRVWLFTVLAKISGGEPAAKPIQAESDAWPRKIRRRIENTKGSWVHPVISVLLAGCCAITVFFAFQAPFRLGANANRAGTGEFRGEIAALPTRSAGQTVSDFRAQRSHRSGGDREVVSSSFDDSGHKRRLAREHIAQRKQPNIRIESAESRRN